MTANNVRQSKRAYQRNLGWCRFWLGIGIAIATLTFSFTVDRVFDTLLQPAAAGAGEWDRQPDAGSPDRIDDSKPNRQSDVANTPLIQIVDVVVVVVLLIIVLACVFLAWRFRDLYHSLDQAIGTTEKESQEDTP